MVTKKMLLIKDQSEIVMKEANKVADLFQDAFNLAIYQEFKDGSIITWEELKVIKIGDKLGLPSSTSGEISYSRQVDENEDTLQYLAYFEEDSILPRHEHDCTEVVFVNKGSFSVSLGRKKDGTFKTVDVNEGEVINVPANTQHQFINTFIGKTEVKIKYLKP